MTSRFTRFHVLHISRSYVISQINYDQAWSGQLLICACLFITDLTHRYTNTVITNILTKVHVPRISRSSVIYKINWDQLWSAQILLCAGLFKADLAHVYTLQVYAGHVTKFHFPHISRSWVISQINWDQLWSGQILICTGLLMADLACI